MRGARTSIENLAITWQSLDGLCEPLTEAEWKTPTGCPGWNVQDNVAHLIDYESSAMHRPRPEHRPSELSHTKNAMGESNEVGVDYRRAWVGADVFSEFREVTAARLAQLRALTDADLEAETMTPAGPGTVATMLTLRVMDTWAHEQDIRRALAIPGHAGGPVAEESVAYWAQFLPVLVGKRAAAPEGSAVRFVVGAVYESTIEVVDGRARVAAPDPGAPTVTLTMPAPTFAALVGGRSDAPHDVQIVGDRALGDAVIAHLGFLP